MTTCTCCTPPPAVEAMTEAERQFMAGAGFMMTMSLLGAGLLESLCAPHRKMLMDVLGGIDHAHKAAGKAAS